MTESVSAFIFTPLLATQVSDDLLEKCAKLFSASYGIWGKGGPRPGSSVKMPVVKLKNMLIENPESTALATCTLGGSLIGHAFATVWAYEGGRAAWVTQLVVTKEFRRRYVATQLVQTFKRLDLFSGLTAIGVASTQPASIAACIKYSNVQPGDIDIDFITANAPRILKASPVAYLQASLHGSAFEHVCKTAAVSSIFTNFYVDHNEPMEALRIFHNQGRWRLGELLEGHEFLAIVPVDS